MIYETPANIFVAKFIGSPPMNMLDATVSVSGGKAVAVDEATGTRIDLSGYGFTSPPVDGQKIVLGLRPEHFSLGDGEGAAAGHFNLPLLYSEKTGSDASAFFTTKGELMAVRVDPAKVGKLKVGEPVRLSFPGDKLNVFDAQTGRRM